MLVSTFFLSRSRRVDWLVLHDRHDEGLASLSFLRRGKFTEQQIQDEFSTIQAAYVTALSATRSRRTNTNSNGNNTIYDSENNSNVYNLWNRWCRIWNPKYIKRTGIVLVTNFFLHGTGNACASVYGTIFSKSIGTLKPLQPICHSDLLHSH